MEKKIIVLDDDPTGCQTVHGINVYTTWKVDSLNDAFLETNNLFYILTNSRSLTPNQTQTLHRELIQNIVKISKKFKCDFDIISRSDSTLRGHYPLEPDVIREELEKNGKSFNGEFIIPFFKEGGRITKGDVHYIEQGNLKVPAGESEFAKDATFGYKSSNLKEWIEEKTQGAYAAGKVKSISLDILRSDNLEAIVRLISKSEKDQKYVVNATTYEDLEPFVTALKSQELKSKSFIFRTAASFVKVYGAISDKPLLSGNQMRQDKYQRGGLVIVGSHVQKTTMQLNNLINNTKIKAYELDVFINKDQIIKSIEYIVEELSNNIEKGINSVIYTSRKLLKDPHNDAEKNLKIAVDISNYLVSILDKLSPVPGFIIAKGGITSSDIATKGLRIKKALVLGQILPGIPVWQPDEKSKFPKVPYVVFPGNVGEINSLSLALTILDKK